jgi:hypothetical protein
VNNHELERKAEVAELLLHAARRLGESIEPERIYERFHELLADVIQHDGLVISSYDDRDELIRAEYAWTDGAVLDVSSFPALPLNRAGGGMQSRVIVEDFGRAPARSLDFLRRLSDAGCLHQGGRDAATIQLHSKRVAWRVPSSSLPDCLCSASNDQTEAPAPRHRLSDNSRGCCGGVLHHAAEVRSCAGWAQACATSHRHRLAP